MLEDRAVVAVDAELEMHDLLGTDRPLQGGRGVQRDDPSVVDDRDAVAELVSLFHVMRRQKHGASLCTELAHAVAQISCGLRIEAYGGLIEDHQRRVRQERPREREALPHTGRIAFYVVVRTIREVDRRQCTLDPRACLVRRNVVQRREVLEVLASGQLPVKAPLAGEHRAEPRANVARPLQRIDAADANAATRRDEERRQHLHGGRLAGSVGPEEAKDLAGLDPQVDPIDGAEALAPVRLAPEPLPDRASAALEDLDKVLRLDRRSGHST